MEDLPQDPKTAEPPQFSSGGNHANQDIANSRAGSRVSTPAVAANRSVPSDCAAIQEAVHAAAPGDIINVGTDPVCSGPWVSLSDTVGLGDARNPRSLAGKPENREK